MRIALLVIIAVVGAAILLPVLFPLPPVELDDPVPPDFWRKTSPSRAPRGSETGDPAAPILPSAPERSPAVETRAIPELPELDAFTATPALLSRAKELAHDFPDEVWLQQYVVATELWLSSRRRDERRFDEALDYLDESEDWGAPPGDVASYRAFIYRNQNAWQEAETWARAALTQGSEVDPAEMHHIIGSAHYFREEIDRAIRELEEALAIRDDPRIRESLEVVRRHARTSTGFSNKRLSHFIVSYEGETMESVGRMAIDTLERNYASLVSELGFEPKEPVSVILYTRRSFEEMRGGGGHPVAGLFDGKIRLPVRDVHWGDDYIRRILHHELSHAFFYSRTGGHDPRWLNEGLAEYVTGQRTVTLGAQLAPQLDDGGTLEGCLLASLYNCELYYQASTSLVDYMIQLRGMGGIRDVLTHLGEDSDRNRALRDVYGRDERSLIRDWEHFVRRRH